MMRSIDEQVAIMMQGTAYGDATTHRSMENELRAALAEPRPLRVYCGFDPRTKDLHLGHTVPIYKLRQMQELGHEVTFLIGTYTSLIGDPSDKDKLRPQLTFAEVMENAQTYAEQAYTILDRSRTKVAFNHEWLQSLTFAQLIELASVFTVQQFLTRDNFRKRFDEGEAIYLHEFFYALMQGYDAVAQQTDIQVGGSDQLFNILTAGRKLQSSHNQRPQVGIILDILPGTDGVVKMSKSLGNHIPIHATPEDMYGKVMSLPDHVMPNFFKLVTRYEPAAIAAIEADLAAGARHPRDIKMELAREIVSMFHGEEGAAAGQAHFERDFVQKDIPEDMPEFVLTATTRVTDILADSGLVPSKGQVKRLMDSGSVHLDGEPLHDVFATLEPGQEHILKVGKRRFLKVR